jgi:hypothetical protein
MASAGRDANNSGTFGSTEVAQKTCLQVKMRSIAQATSVMEDEEIAGLGKNEIGTLELELTSRLVVAQERVAPPATCRVMKIAKLGAGED